MKKLLWLLLIIPVGLIWLVVLWNTIQSPISQKIISKLWLEWLIVEGNDYPNNNLCLVAWKILDDVEWGTCCEWLKAIHGVNVPLDECQNFETVWICAPCWNNICEQQYHENHCSCPQDCLKKEDPKNQTGWWNTVANIYQRYKSIWSDIEECTYNWEFVYSAWSNAYDAGNEIYDKNWIEIAKCYFNAWAVDEMCKKLENCIVIYRVKWNIWGQPFVDVYGLEK